MADQLHQKVQDTSFNNPTIKFAFFAEGRQNDVVEALHRAAEQLNSRKMKSYNSPVSTPAVIRWFRQ